MKKAAIVFLALISQTVISIAQTTSQNLIEWNEFYTLTWEDFEGVRTDGSIGDAGTAVSIKAKPYMVKNKVKYNVYAYFNREKSWAADKSDELLKHEQLHFDIAELYARKIRKRISELSASGVNDVKIYNKEIQELLEESNSADVQYDLETLHGAMIKRQAAWEKNVKQELEALAKYKKVKKVITSFLSPLPGSSRRHIQRQLSNLKDCELLCPNPHFSSSSYPNSRWHVILSIHVRSSAL